MSDTNLADAISDSDIKVSDDLHGLKSAFESVKGRNRELRDSIKGQQGQIAELRKQVAVYAENERLRRDVSELRRKLEETQ